MADKLEKKISNLYGKYFQKSRSFLYPALNIRRNSDFPPTGTYMSLEGITKIEDCKLICSYKDDESEDFLHFEKKMLIGNQLFIKKMPVKSYNLYLFDYQSYTNDWFNVIMGKYSKLSVILKDAIKEYYGETSNEYKHMKTFLHPDRYYDIYAHLLDVDISLLKEVGELCDPCDIEKETLIIPVEDLEIIQKLT